MYEFQHKNPIQKRVAPIPKAQYGGRHTVTMLPGESCFFSISSKFLQHVFFLGGGIGQELMNYVKEIFRYAGVPVDFEIIDIDPNSDHNDDLEYAITSIKRNGVALKGNIETKSEATGVLSRNVAIRNELDLFVNVVNIKSYPGVRSHYQDVDLYIVRQNTEGSDFIFDGYT